MRGSITRKVNVIRSADSTLYPMKFYRCQSLRAAGMIRTNYGLANRLAPPLNVRPLVSSGDEGPLRRLDNLPVLAPACARDTFVLRIPK